MRTATSFPLSVRALLGEQATPAGLAGGNIRVAAPTCVRPAGWTGPAGAWLAFFSDSCVALPFRPWRRFRHDACGFCPLCLSPSDGRRGHQDFREKGRSIH